MLAIGFKTLTEGFFPICEESKLKLTIEPNNPKQNLVFHCHRPYTLITSSLIEQGELKTYLQELTDL